jgi:hypothetical protein
MPRALRMTVSLALAMVLAGLSAICLGLVDAGRELEDVLGRLEHEAAALHRVTGSAVAHGASVAPITRPRTSLKSAIDGFGVTADRIVHETAPPYARPVARSLSSAIDLVPAAEPIDRALRDYLDQSERAQNEKAPTASAAELSGRLLDRNSEMLVQKIGQARGRTHQAVSTALFGVQTITLLSIGIGALAIGMVARARPAAPYRPR